MKPSVLVADDDRAIREALARALELDGYAVVPATDGVEALAAVAGAAVELIVLDVMMPGVDGLQVCRVLRGQGDRTPILMLTRGWRPPTGSPGSTRAPTTTWSNRSRWTSCWPGCGRCCGAADQSPAGPRC